MSTQTKQGQQTLRENGQNTCNLASRHAYRHQLHHLLAAMPKTLVAVREERSQNDVRAAHGHQPPSQRELPKHTGANIFWTRTTAAPMNMKSPPNTANTCKEQPQIVGRLCEVPLRLCSGWSFTVRDDTGCDSQGWKHTFVDWGAVVYATGSKLLTGAAASCQMVTNLVKETRPYTGVCMSLCMRFGGSQHATD